MNARPLLVVILSFVLVACAQSPTPTPVIIVVTATPQPTPIPSSTSVPPTATSVPPTATPVPATATRVPPTSTPLPTFTPRPAPTSQFPPIPEGMGGLISTNYIGPKDRTVNLEVGGKNYVIPGEGGQVVIHLAPGRYTFSANIARYGKARCEMLNGCTFEIKLGQYIFQPWY